MMNQKAAPNQFTRREERKILELASEYVRSGFPNPERLGCPGSEALKSIAGRHLKFPEAEDIVDHIATCSPCFLEYHAIRRRSRRRLVGGTALCCLLGLLSHGATFGALRRPYGIETRLLHNDPDIPQGGARLPEQDGREV